MSRDRAYSAASGASSGYGSEDHHSHHGTPRRKKKGGGHHHPPHYHDMTLICHRVDVFDDFVPSRGRGDAAPAEGLVPVRCLGPERGCTCHHAPCMFCHMVVEDQYDGPSSEESVGLPSILLGGGNGAGAATNQAPAKPKEPATETTVTQTLVVDPIFANNHHLLNDGGGVKVKKYHHPPVGRYRFVPPLQALPQFFDDAFEPKHNGHPPTETPPVGQISGHEYESKEDDDGGLDSFFDDFAMKQKIEAPKPPPRPEQKEYDTLAFRAPLKTVVKKTITSNSHCPERCLCQRRYDNLKKGSAQPNPHPSVVQDKYWAQRRRLFTRFDEGVRLDAEGWYSVTPEAVADHVASRFADAAAQLVRCQANPDARGGNRRRGQTKKPSQAMVILDSFCGCGGNAIAFAKLPASTVSLVVCIDIDREKLRNAAHNASIYRIPPNRIVFVEANSVAVMERCYRDGQLIMDPPPRTPEALSAYPPREIYNDFTIGGIDLLAEYAQHIDAVFMDPPWGGVDYGAMGKDGYDLSRDMKIRGCERGCVGFPPTPEVDGVRLLKIAAAATSTRFVAYDLPRNTNKGSLAAAALEAGYEGNSKLEEHYLNGRLKTVTAYFGQDFRHLLDLKKYHKPNDDA
ncbi:hypothetical protein ACHAXT_001257 [Thalassiosira profunda]